MAAWNIHKHGMHTLQDMQHGGQSNTCTRNKATTQEAQKLLICKTFIGLSSLWYTFIIIASGMQVLSCKKERLRHMLTDTSIAMPEH